MSALGDQIKLTLAKGGAITVERFMELALADPQYSTRSSSPERKGFPTGIHSSVRAPAAWSLR